MFFPRSSARSEAQIASSRIWIRMADFISFDNNRYTMCVTLIIIRESVNSGKVKILKQIHEPTVAQWPSIPPHINWSCCEFDSHWMLQWHYNLLRLEIRIFISSNAYSNKCIGMRLYTYRRNAYLAIGMFVAIFSEEMYSCACCYSLAKCCW